MEKFKRSNKLQLLLTDLEINTVDSLRMYLGGMSRSEVVRYCIRDKFERESDYIRKRATLNKKFNKS